MLKKEKKKIKFIRQIYSSYDFEKAGNIRGKINWPEDRFY